MNNPISVKSVLMIGNYLPSPKYNKNVWHFLAERLQSNGWTVLTVSSKENKFLRLLDMLWTPISKRKAYRVAQVDVFSGQAFYFALLSAILLRWLKKPFVLTLHGGGLTSLALRRRRLFSFLLNCPEVVVTPSSSLRKSLGKIRPDILFMPNPIDIPDSIYRNRVNLRPNLIWIRAFHEAYNPSLAVQVLHALSQELPDVRLIMIGPDKQDGSLQKAQALVDRYGLHQHAEFVGGILHTLVPAWLDQADIFLNTTNFDTAPRSLLEAMANGLCVISTNVGGIPDIVTDGQNGLLVPPNDTEKMTEAVIKVLQNPELAGQLSQNARLSSLKNDWSLILPRWDELLSEIAAK